jgi:hypothetical protein
MESDGTLAGMVRHGTDVKLLCKVCNRAEVIDTTEWARRLGGRTTLWNYFIPCRFEDCPDGLMMAHARLGNCPFAPLSNYLVLSDRLGGWDFCPTFPSVPPYRHGIE